MMPWMITAVQLLMRVYIVTMRTQATSYYVLFIREDLEYLSIKDTTLSPFQGGEEQHLIPQGLLMNMT